MFASNILPMMRRHSGRQSVRRLRVRKRRLPPDVPPLKRSIRHRFTQSSQVDADSSCRQKIRDLCVKSRSIGTACQSTALVPSCDGAITIPPQMI